MRSVSLESVKCDFEEVADSVADDSLCVISRPDGKDVILMSLEHYNGLMETMYLLRSPANSKHLKESIAQLQNDKAKD